jgi:hypothetical protein
MNYRNILIHILVFVVITLSFYLIISNYRYSNINLYSKNKNDTESLKQYFSQLETKINSIEDNTLQENMIKLKNDLDNIIKSDIIKNKNVINTESEYKNPLEVNNQNNLILTLEEKIKNLESQLNNIKIKLDDDIQINLIQPPSNNDNNNDINDNNDNNNSNYNNTNPINQNTIVVDPIANYDRAKLLDPLVDPRGRTSADQIPAPIIAAQFNFPTQGILDRYHRVGLLMAVDHNDNNSNNSNNSNHSDNDSLFDNDYKKSIKEKAREKKKKYNDNRSSENIPVQYNGVEIADNKSIEGFENAGNTYNYINYNASENDILELIGKKITDNWYKYFTSISKGNKIIKINVHNRNRKELYSGDEIYIPELHKRYIVKIDYMDQIEYNPYIF